MASTWRGLSIWLWTWASLLWRQRSWRRTKYVTRQNLPEDVLQICAFLTMLRVFLGFSEGSDFHEGEALVDNFQPSTIRNIVSPQVTRCTQKLSVFEAKRWPDASDASDATVRLMNTRGFDYLPVVSSAMTFLPCGLRIWGVRQQHSSVLNQHHLCH